MIIGKYSAIKGFFLFVLIVLAIVDIIATYNGSSIAKVINCVLVVLGVAGTVRYFWNKWAEKI